MASNDLNRLGSLFDEIKESTKDYNVIKTVPEPEPISSADEKRRIMLSIIKSADCKDVYPRHTVVTNSNMKEPFVQYYNAEHDKAGYGGHGCGKEGGFHTIDEYDKPMITGSSFYWGCRPEKGSGFTFYGYDSIPKSKRPNLFRFDKNFRYEEMVGMYDTGSDCTDGIVFMLSGLYVTSTFGRKFISYSDIHLVFSPVYTSTGEIEMKNGDKYKYEGSNFDCLGLQNLIEELVLVDKSFKTSRYRSGKTESLKVDYDSYFAGEKDGYVRASAEYEKKLRDQAKKFLEKENEWKTERDEYEALLDDCAKTIDELEAKIANGGGFEYQNRRDSVVYLYNDLKNLRSA